MKRSVFLPLHRVSFWPRSAGGGMSAVDEGRRLALALGAPWSPPAATRAILWFWRRAPEPPPLPGTWWRERFRRR